MGSRIGNPGRAGEKQLEGLRLPIRVDLAPSASAARGAVVGAEHLPAGGFPRLQASRAAEPARAGLDTATAAWFAPGRHPPAHLTVGSAGAEVASHALLVREPSSAETTRPRHARNLPLGARSVKARSESGSGFLKELCSEGVGRRCSQALEPGTEPGVPSGPVRTRKLAGEPCLHGCSSRGASVPRAARSPRASSHQARRGKGSVGLPCPARKPSPADGACRGDVGPAPAVEVSE